MSDVELLREAAALMRTDCRGDGTSTPFFLAVADLLDKEAVMLEVRFTYSSHKALAVARAYLAAP